MRTGNTMDIETYRAVLNQVVRRAHEGRNYIEEAVYRELTEPLSMTEEEDRLTREYLAGLKIRFGTPPEESSGEESSGDSGESSDSPDSDGGYLDFYLEDLKSLPQYSDEEILRITERAIEDDREAKDALIHIHLKDVVDIAKLYVWHGIPLSDLIGEGNLGLMAAVDLMSTLDSPEEAEGFIGKFIMDAMDAAIAADSEDRSGIVGMLERLEGIGKAAKELSEDLRRPVTAEELARESEFELEEIEEALRLTGKNLEGLI